MSERDYRTPTDKFMVDDLYIPSKEAERTERQAKIMQCVVLVIAFGLLMMFGPGEW